MKTIYHFIAPLLGLITMVACAEIEVSEEANDSINNGILQELSITGKDFIFDGETRSTVTIGESGASFTWDEDDVIGIFPDKGDQVSFAMDKGAGTQTATFSGGGWALKSSAKYAAYYPHVYENRDMTKIPVSYVGQTQNGNGNTDHIGAYDFMAAGVSTPENGAVAFDMQHLGALVQLTITIPKASTISRVVLDSSIPFTETGTINLNAETPAITAVTESNTLEVALNNVVTTEANENIIVYFMTAPVDLTDSKLTATVYFADEMTSEVELTGKKMQAGKAYRFIGSQPGDYIDEYGVNHGKGTEIDGVIWAPVNCGYHKINNPYGKLYQWGRRFGQGYDGNLYDVNENIVDTYSDAIVPTTEEGGVSVATGNHSDNSNVFYLTTDDYNFDWVDLQDDKLWNSGEESKPVKTNYDPCPAGWRVPTYAELNDLRSNKSSWTTNADGQVGYWFSGVNLYTEEVSQVFFPAAGDRGPLYADADYRGRSGSYWSSKPTNYGYSYYLSFRNDRVTMSNYARALGYSVRCVHE